MTNVDDPDAPVVPIEDELAEAKRQVETLRIALVSRAVIDQAKGMLMALYRIDAGAAFEMLSRVSQSENVKVARLAQAMVDVAAAECADPKLDEVVRRRLLAPASDPARGRFQNAERN